MGDEEDSRHPGQRTVRPEHDLEVTQTAAHALPEPLAEGPAHGLTPLPTATMPPPSGPIADRASSSRALLHAGATLKHYEILRQLGQGGMGTVFLARDTKLGRLCAIKVLLEYTGQRAARFLAEARATARCKHENIVVIHEVDELQSCPYMVLEYLEGRTLREWMTQRSSPGAPALPAAHDSRARGRDGGARA